MNILVFGKVRQKLCKYREKLLREKMEQRKKK